MSVLNYQKIYEDFISARKSSGKPSGYSESHHIVPKSIGGTDSKDNLIDLSARDHVFAHLLLAKIHGGPMFYAYWMMVSGCASYRARRNGELVRVPSHLVAIAKRKRSETMSATRSGENHHFYGINHSEEVRKKISVSLKNKYDEGYICPTKGRVASDEERAAMSLRMKKRFNDGMAHPMLGKTHTPEARAKISAAQTGELNRNYGKPLSREHAENIGLAQIGIKNHAADMRIMKFSNKKIGEFIGYRSEFIRKYGLCKANIGRLVNGSQKQHKGWFFDGVAE